MKPSLGIIFASFLYINNLQNLFKKKKIKRATYLQHLNHFGLNTSFAVLPEAVAGRWGEPVELELQKAQEQEQDSPDALAYQFEGPSSTNHSDRKMPKLPIIYTNITVYKYPLYIH